MGRLITFLLAVLAPAAAVAQPLVCPTTPSGTCMVFHFHVQMFRPDTKGFQDLSGINRFASPQACDRARESYLARNAAVVDHIRRTQNDQQYQADRVGPCHCDMTAEKTSPNVLTDLQRTAQIRIAEEIRQRVRERLMDIGLTTDSELIRGLSATAPPDPLLGGPKLVALPRQAAAPAASSADELKSTKAVESGAPAMMSLDLPLVDVVTTGQASVETPGADDDAADSFVSVETARIQGVLKAGSELADEGLKAKIIEACMQRIQLLSNLRLLIQGAGTRSHLAAAARSAKTDDERLALVGRLFGNEVKDHWAPKEPQAVVLNPIAGEAEKVLRDTSGKTSDQQKRRAFYEVLGRSEPTEDQQLFLLTVIEGFL